VRSTPTTCGSRDIGGLVAIVDQTLDESFHRVIDIKYPIDTPERARSALARVKQFGSPEDQRKVKTAVQKKYPNMKTD
jgi:hypothetical protein